MSTNDTDHTSRLNNLIDNLITDDISVKDDDLGIEMEEIRKLKQLAEDILENDKRTHLEALKQEIEDNKKSAPAPNVISLGEKKQLHAILDDEEFSMAARNQNANFEADEDSAVEALKELGLIESGPEDEED